MRITADGRWLISAARYGMATLVSCALVVPASGQPTGSGQQQPATTTVGSSVIVDSEDIVRNPAKYYGKTVMVQPDDVDRVVNRHMFLLDEDAAFAGPDILVLVPSPAGAVANGQDVTITGTVRPYVRTDIERDYDWFDGDGLDVDLTDRPVIVATSVKASDGRELAGVVAEVPARGAANRATGVIEAGELAENPEAYIGRRVTVRAEVEQVYNPQLFTLDEDRMLVGPDVIVYAQDGRTSLTEAADQHDRVVTVTGVVRKFIETDLFGTATWFEPWFRDLDEAGRGLVRSRPVIIAESVTAAGGAQLYTANASEPKPKTRQSAPDSSVGTTGTTSDTQNDFAAGSRITATGTIEAVANTGVFWVTVDGRAEPVLVISDTANPADMTTGGSIAASQRVVVIGTVKSAPGGERIYIDAKRVSPATQ